MPGITVTMSLAKLVNMDEVPDWWRTLKKCVDVQGKKTVTVKSTGFHVCWG